MKRGTLSALLLATLCMACGQKGALYLPAKANVVTRPAGATSGGTPPSGNQPQADSAPASDTSRALPDQAAPRKEKNTVPPASAYPDTARPTTPPPPTSEAPPQP
jgi:predicted small lipoprotein YifL